VRKVLVFGDYPPTPGPEAAATLACVRDLVAEGAEVTVVSPVPSGAHHHADPRTPAGAARLLRWSRSADALVLCGQTHAPGPPRGRREAVARRLVELALRRAGSVTEHRGVVVEQPAAPLPEPAGPARVGDWQLGPVPTREELQAEVRRRAAASRGGRSTAPSPGQAGALRRLEPLGPAPAQSAKPGMGLVKRVVLRLTGFQVNPIIEHVNLLHRATLEALEDQESKRTS
jgi:hypothetical protein